MDAPTVTSAGQTFYDMVEDLHPGDDTNDWATLVLCDAAGAMLQGLDTIVAGTADGQPGWVSVVDPEQAPAAWLPYTGGLYGVTPTVGAPEAQQRTEIVDLPPQHRGTIAALTTAVAQTLTGAKVVRTVERPSGQAYQIDVLTRTAETPDPTLTAAVAQSEKAAALVMTVDLADGPIVDEGTRTIDAADGNIDTATLANVT